MYPAQRPSLERKSGGLALRGFKCRFRGLARVWAREKEISRGKEFAWLRISTQSKKLKS